MSPGTELQDLANPSSPRAFSEPVSDLGTGSLRSEYSSEYSPTGSDLMLQTLDTPEGQHLLW